MALHTQKGTPEVRLQKKPDYAVTVLVGEAYESQRSFDKAEPYYLRALEVDKILFGPDSVNLEPEVARLAHFYKRWGRFDKAEPYWRELLALEEKKYGPESSLLPALLNEFAEVLANVGQVDEAVQVRQRIQMLMAKDKK